MYKGFTKDLKCLNFQYEIGKTYHTEDIALCVKSFHACENPLDVLYYYPPAYCRYCEVELTELSPERTSEDTKRVGKTIHIIKELSLMDMYKAAYEYYIKNEDCRLKESNDYTGYIESKIIPASIVKLDKGHSNIAANAGSASISHTRSVYGIAATSRGHSISIISGRDGVAVATGIFSVAADPEEDSHNSIALTSGYKSLALVKSPLNVAITTGEQATAQNNSCGLAIAAGSGSYACGAIGSFLVLTEWGDEGPIDVRVVKVDGEKIKPNVKYTLYKGEIIEGEEEIE